MLAKLEYKLAMVLPLSWVEWINEKRGGMKKFKPCAIQYDDTLEVVLKDCFTVYQYWGSEGVQIGYDEDHNVVSIQVPSPYK